MNDIVKLPFILFQIVLFLLFAAVPHDSQAFDVMDISLEGAVRMAMGENIALKISSYSVPIAEGDLAVSRSEFDPSLGLDIGESYRRGTVTSALSGSYDRSLKYDLSLAGKLKTGTSYDFAWITEKFESDLEFLVMSPYYKSDLTLTLRQPLLKNMGIKVQESRIEVARNNLTLTKLENGTVEADVVLDTIKAYWGLYSAHGALDSADLSLKLAQSLFDEVNAKIDAGVLSKHEVYAAEASVYERRSDLIIARKAVADSEDTLKALMNLANWDTVLKLTSTPTEGLRPRPLDESIEMALSGRNEIKQAEIDIQNASVMQRYYENQKYPDLGVYASGGLNGVNDGYGGAYDRLSSGDDYAWGLGMYLSYPIGNRKAGGELSRARFEELKSKAGLEEARQRITIEVREGWRASMAASENLAASEKAREASEWRLKAEEERFRVGLATVNDVLDAQEDFTRSLSRKRNAEADYATSLARLERYTGTLSVESIAGVQQSNTE